MEMEGAQFVKEKNLFGFIAYCVSLCDVVVNNNHI